MHPHQAFTLNQAHLLELDNVRMDQLPVVDDLTLNILGHLWQQERGRVMFMKVVQTSQGGLGCRSHSSDHTPCPRAQ